MKILPTRRGVQQAVEENRCSSKTIGLVPTMGALHEGHLALVRISKQHSDITLVSIFVNPTQFNDSSDLNAYPRTLEKDLYLLEEEGVDYVFVPEIQEIYIEPAVLSFNFGLLESTLEGKYRPSHFNGVGTIVAKLFHIVHPHQVYLGQKDLQQIAVIKRLVIDLSFDLEIVVVPTVREQDGLAMSSRNALLSGKERRAASILYQTLSSAKNELLTGRPWFEIKQETTEMYKREGLAKLEYFELVKANSMEIVSDLTQDDTYSICTACFIGTTRLIDNITVA